MYRVAKPFILGKNGNDTYGNAFASRTLAHRTRALPSLCSPPPRWAGRSLTPTMTPSRFSRPAISCVSRSVYNSPGQHHHGRRDPACRRTAWRPIASPRSQTAPIRPCSTTCWSMPPSASPPRSCSTKLSPQRHFRAVGRGAEQRRARREDEQRPDGHELLVQVRDRAQPVARPAPACRSWAISRRSTRSTSPTPTRPSVVDPTNPVPGSDYRVVAERRCSSATSTSPRPTPIAATTAAPRSSTTPTAPTSITPPAMPATAAIRSRTASSSAPARRSSRASKLPLSQQMDPGLPTPVGCFSITELGVKADKVGKDTNFRGLTVFNNVIYVTKGSGQQRRQHRVLHRHLRRSANGNPAACPKGTGVPSPSATLPTTADRVQRGDCADRGRDALQHVHPERLPDRAGQGATDASMFPFGVWFANATTLYVADEGNGDNTFDAAPTPSRRPPRRPRRACRSGCSTRRPTPGRSPTRCRPASISVVPYTVKDYPTGNNPRPACRGRRRPTACATSPAASIATAR